MTLFRLLSRQCLHRPRRHRRPFSSTTAATTEQAAKLSSYLCGPAERPLTDLTIGQVVDRADREQNFGDEVSNERKLEDEVPILWFSNIASHPVFTLEYVYIVKSA